MKCFYHNDGDGKCAAYWVRHHNSTKPGHFIQIDHHMPFPFDTIEENEEVFIVDFHISPSDMDVLLKITPNVTWIDHHISAINKFVDYHTPIRGVRVDGIAACMLSYVYFTHMTRNGRGDIKPFDESMTEDAPLFTKLLADYDVWTFAYGDDTRHFQVAFNASDITPITHHWKQLMDEDVVRGYILDGRTQLRYRDAWAKTYCGARGFVTEFEGYKCYAMNLGLCSSEYFKSVEDNGYDIFIPFSFDGNRWHYSLYSTKVNVSEIAVKYGGGGHAGASGFNLPDLILKKA